MKLSIPRLLLSIGTNNSSVWNIVREHSVSVLERGHMALYPRNLQSYKYVDTTT